MLHGGIHKNTKGILAGFSCSGRGVYSLDTCSYLQMTAEIREMRPVGKLYLGTLDMVPQCGRDHCDQCGDCLVCHEEDRCAHNESGRHRWVIWVDTRNTQWPLSKG